MKERDNSKIHISSNFILSISLLIMFDTLLLRPSLHCNTPLHFTRLHHTLPNYTSLHFTTLYPTTLHYTYRHFTSSHLHFTILSFSFTLLHFLGHAVTQLVEALCYKPEVRGFDSRWCHWNFSLT